MGERGVLRHREALADRDERHEPVLELRPLCGLRRTREDLEPGVDLQRVGRHRNGGSPARADPLCERDRDIGLANPGRAEERED